MGPLAVAAIPAAISGIGSLFGNKASAKDAARNREFNAAEAEKSRQFTAAQSATEVQRRVADLKAAGLNPALAYSQGGASAPSSTAASSGSMGSYDNVGGAGVSSAIAAVSLANQMEQMAINRKVADAQVLKTGAETAQTLAMTPVNVESGHASTKRNVAEAAFLGTQNRNMWESFELRQALVRAQIQQTLASARDVTLRFGREEDAYRNSFGRFAPFVNSGKAALRDVWNNYGKDLYQKLLGGSK